MDKMIEQFRDLLERIKKLDPKLYAELVRVIRGIEREFVKRYGVPEFRGWIDDRWGRAKR